MDIVKSAVRESLRANSGGFRKPEDAKYIWYDAHGEGRNRYAMFRRTFELKQIPDQAKLHLFADSFYTLWINGIYVNFGPTRFDPRYPQFDTHDLSALLQIRTVLIGGRVIWNEQE